MHLFQSFEDAQSLLDYVLEPLDLPQQTEALGEQQLGLDALERARQAAAAGDRAEVVLALQDAGADADLASALAEALSSARCMTRLLRTSQPPTNLTLLIGFASVWTLWHGGSQDPTVRVDRPSGEALRQQLAHLWAT